MEKRIVTGWQEALKQSPVPYIVFRNEYSPLECLYRATIAAYGDTLQLVMNSAKNLPNGGFIEQSASARFSQAINTQRIVNPEVVKHVERLIGEMTYGQWELTLS